MIQVSSRVYPPVHHFLRHCNRKKWIRGIAIVSVLSIVTGLWLVVLPVVMLVSILGGLMYASFEYGLKNFVLEVWDDGDQLQVERKGERASLPLAQIDQIDYTRRHNPPRAHVRLRTPCQWGTELTYLPDLSQGRDQAKIVIDQLNARIREAQTT